MKKESQYPPKGAVKPKPPPAPPKKTKGVIDMKVERRTQILRNGKWMDDEFKNIKKGDVFRLFEPDGETVKDIAHNRTKFKATTNAIYSTEHETFFVNEEVL